MGDHDSYSDYSLFSPTLSTKAGQLQFSLGERQSHPVKAGKGSTNS